MNAGPRWAEQRTGLPEELASALRGAPGEPSEAALEFVASNLSSSLGLSIAAPQAAVATTAIVSLKPALALIGSTLLGAAIGVGLSAVVAVSFGTGKQAERGNDSRAVPTVQAPLPPTVVAPRTAQPAADRRAAPHPSRQPLPISSPGTKTDVDSSPLEPMEAEIALLRQARAALINSPSRALTLCADHARMFASGALGQEREVIAIDALLRAGRTPEARERARLFLEKFPGSAHARRIAALLEDSNQ